MRMPRRQPPDRIGHHTGRVRGSRVRTGRRDQGNGQSRLARGARRVAPCGREIVMKTLIASIAAACAFVASGAYAQSMFRGDAVHAGVYRDQGPRAFHRVKWKFATGDRIVSSPVYAEGTLYFGGDDGYVYAVSANDGRQLWKYRTGGPVPASPAIAGGVLYVGSYDGKFYALDARTGDTLEVRDRGRAAIRGEGHSWPAAEDADDRRSVRRV